MGTTFFRYQVIVLILTLFDGGAGNDTIEILFGGTIDFTRALGFKNFEIIRGTEIADSISMIGEQLDYVHTIDGRGGENALRVFGPAIDLSNKTLLNIHRIEIGNDGATITTDSLDVAQKISSFLVDNDGLVLKGVVLTDSERLMLRNAGIDPHNRRDWGHHCERGRSTEWLWRRTFCCRGRADGAVSTLDRTQSFLTTMAQSGHFRSVLRTSSDPTISLILLPRTGLPLKQGHTVALFMSTA